MEPGHARERGNGGQSAGDNVTENRDRVDTIREVFSYLRQFRGTTFVVWIDNAVLDDPLFSVVVKDLSLLREAGIRIALVPSAKSRIDEILRTYEVAYQVLGGMRVTTEEAIPFIKMAAFDVSNRVMTMLSENGATAVIGNWVRARGIGVINGVDYQSAGLPESVRVDSVHKVLEDGVVPIFPCIGWSSVGRPYNISSNELAVVVASSLGAEKLIFLTAREGFSADAFQVPETVPVAPGGRLANFSLSDLEAFFRLNPGRESDLELLQRARRACTGGVERVHILDGRREGVILRETFSNLGSGTMVYSNRYGGIRPMAMKDISDVLRIMRPFVERGILLPRSEAQLEEILADYIVFEVDDSVHACAALHEFPEKVGEIAAIAVDEQFLHLGVGPKLVGYLSERAQRRGLTDVFVLTTQTSDWFLKMGFVESEPSVLPEKKRLAYDLQRKSKVFVKALGGAAPGPA
jgi:amino-acid N-acetyltransferase